MGTHRLGDVKHRMFIYYVKCHALAVFANSSPKQSRRYFCQCCIFVCSNFGVLHFVSDRGLGMHRPCQGVPASRDSAFITRLPTALIHTLLAVGKYTCPRSGYVTDVWLFKTIRKYILSKILKKENYVGTHHGVIYTKDPFPILSLFIVEIQ